MRLWFVLGGFFAATLAAVVLAVAIHRHYQIAPPAPAARQVFRANGQVLSLETDGTTVHIAHEEIPGFMPAMTMPFKLKDPSLLRGVRPGDTVRFKLQVTSEDSWITEIEKLSGQPAVSMSLAVATQQPGAAPGRVEPGELVPDFCLTDEHGRALCLRNFRGKAVVLTFIYTRCPLPNFCPLMSKNFASLQERFNKEFGDRVQLLSISFDPQFDTPEVLNRYASLYQHSDRNWTFATGTAGQVDFVSNLFGLVRESAGGLINHDLRTALISPNGKLVHVWRSNVWTPYEVQRMVRETLDAGTAANSAVAGRPPG